MTTPRLLPLRPQPADFILVHIPGDAGRLIQVLQALNGTFTDYEHVALNIGQGAVIEMANGGIQLARLDKYDNVPHRWSTGLIPGLTDQERFDIVEAGQRYLAQHIGYSWEDYGALAARRLHIPAPGLRRYIESTGHMICSQLIAATYRDGGHPLYPYWTGYTTPGDLNQLLGLEATP